MRINLKWDFIRRSPHNAGFTLIELIIVIAIIGILAAIALAALGVARDRGRDAAIQSDLNTIRTQAAIYYKNSGAGAGYGAPDTFCSSTINMFGDPNIKRAAQAADKVNGPSGAIACNVSAGGSAYVVSAQLVTDPSTYWCVDSRGVAKIEPGPLGSGTFCP